MAVIGSASGLSVEKATGEPSEAVSKVFESAAKLAEIEAALFVPIRTQRVRGTVVFSPAWQATKPVFLLVPATVAEVSET